MAILHVETQIIPTKQDFEKLLKAKLAYEPMQSKPEPEKTKWNKKHFMYTPWGISWKVSADPRAKVKSEFEGTSAALRYFIAAIIIGWDELSTQLTKTLKKWGYSKEDMQHFCKIWVQERVADIMFNVAKTAVAGFDPEVKESITLNTLGVAALTEAIEKHDKLNAKLFTADEKLKDKVRNKMLEIVDEFLADLKEQDIKIKVDDILFIGSNASYNYTKDSDIDLHILANAKAASYDPEVAAAIYGAYRTIFNRQLDITLYDIPLEIFVETEDSSRVSNGIYSVKKNKWIKKPVAEEIPEYDKEALDELVDKWETKCKDLIADIKADKLDDEKKVVKMLEDIYEKLRKKGISKGEYSIENLAFKELRNKGYLDQLKDFRNELVSKRLSLEEEFDRRSWENMVRELTRVAYGNRPQFLADGKTFFIYNLKKSESEEVLRNIKKLPFIAEASASESGKYNYSDVAALLRNNMPPQYYNIRGRVNM
jgi:Asp-tRNA(Asn)/Glu-tRNA(Gln) amidotransferase A subunit family amidase